MWYTVAISKSSIQYTPEISHANHMFKITKIIKYIHVNHMPYITANNL